MAEMVLNDASPATVHALLLQVPLTSADSALEEARNAESTLRDAGFAQAPRLLRVAHQSPAGSYVYFVFDEAVVLDAAAVREAERRLRQGGDSLARCRLSRLQLVLHRDGPSIASHAPVHYVVEMDPEEGWREELFRWYDEEHLPGLASVEGTVRADRYLNLDHGPLSLACYDLVGEAVMGCPDWLAVRGTDWSSRVRPHFTNTKRTMFAKLK